ncbi:glycosyltransferase family A protein [Romboutsia lituseburensis]|uniref:glycosyltransferase family A protein n=1 Tax=Romboutsia lituseburensis TaxID=1537 RepID=UPI00215A29C5|nr:glycosyltransferase family 2 protein [Romboutsia lituseburensis]MCR8744696.1 glycosyltransferase family 2 protein [Romboutsia lituseburensis]
MNKKIIVSIVFNTLNFDQVLKNDQIISPRLTKEWIDYRMEIFMKYTCKSLINQSNQSFTAIVHYEQSTENLVMDALSNYEPLPNNIIFTCLPGHDINNLISNYEYVYITRIDSDDVYHPKFIQQLLDFKDNSVECIINQKGYVYDVSNNKLGIWEAQSPPFYTLVYNVEDYYRGKRYKLPNGHPDAIRLKHYILDKYNFMVIVHGKNTSTKFENKFNKKTINCENEKNKILKEFNI